MANTIPIESFFDQQAGGATIEEANRFKVAPKDTYNVKIVKAEGATWKADDPEKRRNVAHLTVHVMKGEKKIATVWPNVSWEERRNKKGNLDIPSRLWGQLAKALFPTDTQADLDSKKVGDVIDAALKYPVGAFITSGFAVPNPMNPKYTNTQTPRSPEEEKEYRTKGYKEVNELLSFSKAQEGK